MPGWFVVALIFAVLAVVALAVRLLPRPGGDTKRKGRATAAVIAFSLAAVIMVIISSFNIVSTRNVGIVTQFGKPVGERGNGIAWIAPWQKITEMDGAIQLQSFQGNSYDDPQSAVRVRLGNNSSAYVELNLNWRIRPGAAPQMFQDYRTFDNIKVNLVDKQAQVALSKEFATFNPQQQTQGADLPTMAQRVKGDLQAAVGDDIEIIDVRIPGLFYDQGTQDRIDEFNKKAQETKNAEQDVKTAQQRKAANDIIAQSVANDPLVIIAQCINESLQRGQPVAGCWPINGVTPYLPVGQPR